MRILGIDPGTSRIGYGLIDKGEALKFIDAGLLQVKEKALKKQLIEINSHICEIIRTFQPQVAALETLYFGKNKKTAMDVAHARGVIVFTLAKHQIPIIEYAPHQIKQAIAGHGGADKKTISRVVEKILKITFENEPDDVSDAIAIALTASLDGSIKTQKGAL